MNTQQGSLARAEGEPSPVIDSVPLFRSIPAAAVAEAFGDCVERSLVAGEVLLRAGSPNDTIYVLLAGRLAAHLGGGDGKQTIVTIDPGESVGEMSVVDGNPASATVTALSSARVLVVPGETFWRGVAHRPAIARNLLAMLSARMRRGNEALLASQRRELALEFLRRELASAREIQASMVPARGRLFPDRLDVEVAGAMDAATEVGGDFFDAFFVDRSTLFLCVGDVSGHGIPAALFMARTMALLRQATAAGRDLGTMLGGVNDELCRGNAANLFVTLFCGLLDVSSGLLIYGNAGHCPPLLVRGDAAGLLPLPRGAFLGMFEGLEFATREVTLEAEQTLVCYTDGVTEAAAADGSAYSTERLLALVERQRTYSVDELVAEIARDARQHSDGGALADDCTVLAIRRRL